MAGAALPGWWAPPAAAPVTPPTAALDAPPPPLVPLPAATQQQQQEEQYPRPCSHNDWDSVRMKRGWAILRCRACGQQWRVGLAEWGTRCAHFAADAGCGAGSSCPLLHVHRRRAARGGDAGDDALTNSTLEQSTPAE